MKVLQCQENDTKLKRFLHKYLPYLPASLPVLLFSRLAELTVRPRSFREQKETDHGLKSTYAKPFNLGAA